MSGALADLLAGALRDAPHAVCDTSGASFAPGEIVSIASAVAGALGGAGVQPSEPVHVRIGNRPGDLGALLGIWQAGAVAVPIHVSAAASTATALQAATGARFLVDGAAADTIGARPPAPRPLLTEAALVLFTSGSTGQPKGAVIGHRRLADKIAVLDRLLALRADDVVLVPLSLTFIFGIWVALLTLRSRGRLLLVPKFSDAAIGEGLRRGATALAAVPSMYRALLAGSPFAAPGLRLAMTGGEVLSRPLAISLQRAAPSAGIVDLYGLTETGSCDFVVGPRDQPEGLGTIGAPTEGVAYRIADANGRAAAPGEPGELQIRTPFGMLGYLDNPQLTEQSFSSGHFRTGDLARLNAAGRVELVGRSKDIVSRGGLKIAPLEIDNLLCEHPEVAAALCAGVPDERLGECMHAVVVRRAGSRLAAEALREWMAARTERFKIPDVIVFADALPAGATGKADRRGVARITAAAR